MSECSVILRQQNQTERQSEFPLMPATVSSSYGLLS